MKKHTGSFMAYTDGGQPVRLHIYTDFVDVATGANPNAVIPGLKELVTGDGLAVNRLDKGKYEVVATGMVLTSDDPGAL
jgi:hypothetical protein